MSEVRSDEDHTHTHTRGVEAHMEPRVVLLLSPSRDDLEIRHYGWNNIVELGSTPTVRLHQHERHPKFQATSPVRRCGKQPCQVKGVPPRGGLARIAEKRRSRTIISYRDCNVKVHRFDQKDIKCELNGSVGSFYFVSSPSHPVKDARAEGYHGGTQ